MNATKCQRSIDAMLAASCRSPAAGSRLSSRRIWSGVNSIPSAARREPIQCRNRDERLRTLPMRSEGTVGGPHQRGEAEDVALTTPRGRQSGECSTDNGPDVLAVAFDPPPVGGAQCRYEMQSESAERRVTVDRRGRTVLGVAVHDIDQPTDVGRRHCRDNR